MFLPQELYILCPTLSRWKYALFPRWSFLTHITHGVEAAHTAQPSPHDLLFNMYIIKMSVREKAFIISQIPTGKHVGSRVWRDVAS